MWNNLEAILKSFITRCLYPFTLCYFVWRSMQASSPSGGYREKWTLTCVASVSMRFRSKEQRTRFKDRSKNGASKRAGRGWGGKEVSFLPLPLPLFHFSVLVSFLVRSKPKIPFHGLFLLRKQTKTLAAQAKWTRERHARGDTKGDAKANGIFLRLASSALVDSKLARAFSRGSRLLAYRLYIWLCMRFIGLP